MYDLPGVVNRKHIYIAGEMKKCGKLANTLLPPTALVGNARTVSCSHQSRTGLTGQIDLMMDHPHPNQTLLLGAVQNTKVRILLWYRSNSGNASLITQNIRLLPGNMSCIVQIIQIIQIVQIVQIVQIIQIVQIVQI